VVRGRGGEGIRLERNGSYLIPKTEEWIMYDARATGFHFLLDKRVPTTMEPLAPALRDLANLHGWDASSRATLTEYGNIAGGVVLDALRRLFDEGGSHHRARGLLAGFGPGITAETALGRRHRTNEETA
jgi:1,3,6,8-tetrahydroxynaphthalene synthase